jgi:hypothetical protein
MPTQMKRYLVHRQESLVIRKNHLEETSLAFLRLKKNKTPQKEVFLNKGNNKITELRTIFQRESQNS